MVRMGNRNLWITIERRRPDAKDPDTGELLPDDHPDAWETYTEFFGSLEPLRGREFWDSQQVQAEVSHTIRTYYVPGITPAMRAKVDGRVFNIEVVRNLKEENRVLEMLVTERV
ncbi:MAG: phage head closure protein [Limnochordales bacterium]